MLGGLETQDGNSVKQGQYSNTETLLSNSALLKQSSELQMICFLVEMSSRAPLL